MTLKFFDSHCHLDFAAFDNDRQALWQRANKQGVQGVLIPGVSPAQWPAIATMSNHLNGCYFAVGLHPWWYKAFCLAGDDASSAIPISQSVQNIEPAYNALAEHSLAQHPLTQQILSHATHKHCKAIGETGLDACMPADQQVPMDTQIAIVKLHLACANQLQLPIILHCRKAHNELLGCLEAIKPMYGGVLHGFTGSKQLAQNYWQRGLRIGVGGSITYSRANKTRLAIQALPDEALVLETDAPTMPLSGKQGERNSPEWIPAIAQALADLRQQPLAQVAQYTLANTQTLFRLKEP